ncbi:MAG: hypothetical protein NTU49_01820 [Gammaproteobacteria bacterium]|nr:hypothetical protein [Gammaproteobacteria bacterium]
MLKKINEGFVESDEGFSIRITGPEIIKYVCNNYSVNIEINYDFKNRKAYIYASKINCWECGGEKVQMNVNNKKSMIENINKAVKLLTGYFEIV